MSYRRPGRPKSKFEPFEDTLLLDIVNQLGPLNWTEIATRLPGRNARQCRERWTNYINPNLVKNEWTEAEDELLVQTYEQVGPKWFMIAGVLPGRAKNSVKNRYFMLQRRSMTEPGTGVRADNPPAHPHPHPHSPAQPDKPHQPHQPDPQTITTDEIRQLPTEKDGFNPFAFFDEFRFNDQDGFDWDPFAAIDRF
jgi:hypothetical protein